MDMGMLWIAKNIRECVSNGHELEKVEWECFAVAAFLDHIPFPFQLKHHPCLKSAGMLSQHKCLRTYPCHQVD